MSGNASSDILVAGALAAFTVDLLVYPLDTLKTRIQSPKYAQLYTNGAAGAVNQAKLFRGLYQGVGSVIIATLPSSGAFFTTYEHTKALLTRLNPTSASQPQGIIPTPIVHAVASSTAELVSCAILTPAEVIKQNAQMVNASSSSSSTNATLQTLAKFRAHPSALWRGYTALSGRNLPFTALQFPLFERIKTGIRGYRDRKGKTTGTLLETGLITALSAGTAGSVAAVVTTPIDVVKTRIMLSAADDAPRGKKAKLSVNANSEGLVDAFGKSAEGPKETIRGTVQSIAQGSSRANGRKSAWAIGKEIMAENGVKGLWRGGALRGVWTMLGSGLYLGTYECGRIWLASRRGESVDDDLF
ncbi:mitochondrial carrier protein [Delitschia confertaspora ATCC 74209]|uniref:Mitochondrial carrier protein n=1 Tax=Delitschia confertaspora ATCC 74209 TaxID=1513339 RepID=A0A9P4JNW0_9PLEO|nr:mitochondrial carrier protein [Delitschia confertaspora ATCC 74209]